MATARDAPPTITAPSHDEDVAALTRGRLDDGLGRAVLHALALLRQGADPDSVRELVQDRAIRLPRGARIPWTNRLAELARELPDDKPAIVRIAVFVNTCPAADDYPPPPS